MSTCAHTHTHTHLCMRMCAHTHTHTHTHTSDDHDRSGPWIWIEQWAWCIWSFTLYLQRVVSMAIRDLVLHIITGTRLDMDRAMSMRDMVLYTAFTGTRLDMDRAMSMTRYPGWATRPPGCGRHHWWGQRSSVTGTAGRCQSEMTHYIVTIITKITTLLRTTLSPCIFQF